ncbi:MAG TPA: ABC transporter permease [Vicinamibacterales bacterium]|nr:ABC transporter permease [Vicinamibacterales bacterium]
MSLGRFLLRRAVFALLLTFVASSAALLLTLVAPGDFATDGSFGDPELMAARRQQLGLDRPILTQYGDWVGRAVRLDFGQSLLYSRPVADLLGDRALNTAVLAAAALGAATVFGIPLGIFTGARQRGAGVTVVRTLSVVMLSMPPLISSLALVLFAARTGWFPVGGMVSAGASEMSWARWVADVAHHVPLPALALALPLAATLERLQSQAMSDAIREPFVRAAEARGLSPDQAMLKHGWRVSLGAVLGLYGLMIGSLFSGSFIVEVVTAWPGLGRLMYDALRARDLYLVAGCAAAGAFFLAVGTFLADVMLAAADPRARMDARS